MIYRRRRNQYIFAGLLAVIAVLNVLFFFILNRPVQAEYESLEESIRDLRAQVGRNKGYFTNLERTSTQLDRFDKDKNALLMKHLIQRNDGYSQIVSTLDSIVQKSGVRKTVVNYSLNLKQQAGLNPVLISIPLQGSYSSVVDFIRELETSDMFFLINSIDLDSSEGRSQAVNLNNAGNAGSISAGNPGSVSLSLALETYFYQ
jgi:Tfp pilus assembly protein PilO